MKKITLISILLFGCASIIFSQPCLPDGITFTTQEQVDNFPFDYPDCTEIEGNVVIKGSDISSLFGLNNLTSIGSYLGIRNSNTLTTLTGLENLSFIGGNLSITSNNSLTNIDALESLVTIGGGILIANNLELTNISGLENLSAESIDYISIWDNTSLSVCEVNCICDFLASPAGSITVYNNAPGCNNPTEVANACGVTLPCLPYGNYYFSTQDDINNFQTNFPGCIELKGSVTISGNSISSLIGLNTVISIDEQLIIRDNTQLSSLNGLNNLTSINGGSWVGLMLLNNINLSDVSGLSGLNYLGGSLTLMNNPELTSLDGLNNINTDSLDHLHITNNSSLSDCEIASLCEFLSSPSGSVTIFNNAMGCDSPTEVATTCGVTMPCLPYGNYFFNNQEDIDNFQTYYPGCTELEGYVEIKGENINNLNGLGTVTRIGNVGLNISENNTLSNLTGLDNLTSIDGYLSINNNSILENLSGLENLNTISGTLLIENNESLSSIANLENLTSISGQLSVLDNDALTTLIGLDNVDAGTISYLRLINNPLLSTCEIESICDYLAGSDVATDIYSNGVGCDSQEEVEEACDEPFIGETPILNSLVAAPNPFSHNTTIRFELLEPINLKINIYNQLGAEVYYRQEQQDRGLQEIKLPVKDLPAGIYNCLLTTGKTVKNLKMIKL